MNIFSFEFIRKMFYPDKCLALEMLRRCVFLVRTVIVINVFSYLCNVVYVYVNGRTVLLLSFVSVDIFFKLIN